jgi:nitrate/nitrite transporter NarK
MGGKHIPTVFSTMNMAGNVGAVVFPLVVPWLVRLTGNWDLVLFVFAGVYLAAAACWLPINPNGTVFDRPRLLAQRK